MTNDASMLLLFLFEGELRRGCPGEGASPPTWFVFFSCVGCRVLICIHCWLCQSVVVVCWWLPVVGYEVLIVECQVSLSVVVGYRV